MLVSFQDTIRKNRQKVFNSKHFKKFGTIFWQSGKKQMFFHDSLWRTTIHSCSQPKCTGTNHLRYQNYTLLPAYLSKSMYYIGFTFIRSCVNDSLSSPVNLINWQRLCCSQFVNLINWQRLQQICYCDYCAKIICRLVWLYFSTHINAQHFQDLNLFFEIFIEIIKFQISLQYGGVYHKNLARKICQAIKSIID